MKPVEVEFLMVDKLSSRLAKCERKIDEFGRKTKNANRNMNELEQTTGKVSKTVAKLASAFAMKELVSNILKVRGQFQQLEVSFTTMLGSAERADALLNQLAKTAATTPFGLEEVGQGAKQLLAYGVEAEKINETLIQLGDIAAGLSIPLNDLVYLYGTTLAQGRLYTQDLNQFTNRGIPMISELAKQFGVAESEVKGLVEAGKVGFPEVQKVIESLTGEGGKFGGLMEAQSKTITGQISNLEDAIAGMFNEIGQQQEGIINSSISTITYVVENYERFGRILLGLVATYGTYKAAVMAVTAAKGWATAAEALHYNWLLLVEKAQKMLNATMLANPYVLVATALAGVAVALLSVKTEAERLQEAEEKYEQELQKLIEAEQEHKRRLEELCSVAGDEAVATATRVEALNLLEQKYPEIFAKYDTEYEKLKNIKRIKEEIASFEKAKSITDPKNELAFVEARISELEKKKQNDKRIKGDRNVSSVHFLGWNLMQEIAGNEEYTADDAALYKTLLKKRESLKKTIGKNDLNAYFENLTGVDNETLAEQIKERQTLLANMTVKKTDKGSITSGNEILRGEFSRDEINYQLNKLKSEQNRRNLPTGTSSDWVAAAKKKYEDALKEYNAFLQNDTDKLNQEDFEKKAKDLKDKMELAKKEYQKISKESDKDADKAKKEADRKTKLKRELGEALIKLQEDNDEAEVKAMQDGFEKKLREIENEYTARINEINNLEAKWKRENADAGVATGENGLTDEQTNALQTARDLAEKNRVKAAAEVERESLKEEKTAMVEYLKQYGSFQQQKLAIAEEYAERILQAERAGDTGKANRLRRQQASEIQAAEIANIKAEIDWQGIFGGLGGLLEEQLKPTLEKLKQYAESDDFREASLQDQQIVYDLIADLEARTTGGLHKEMFSNIARDMKAYQQSLRELNTAKEREREAADALVAAQERLRQAQEIGNATEITQAEDEVAAAQTAFNEAAENVQTFSSANKDAAEELRKSSNNATTSLQGLSEGLQGLRSGSLAGIGAGLGKLGDVTKNLSGTLGTVGQTLAKTFGSTGDPIGMIVSAVLSLLDILKDGIGGLLSDIIDLVFETINGILEDILSGGIITKVGGAIVDGIAGLFDTITFGGFSSWIDDGNAKEVAETINRLTARNEALQTSIEDLTDEIVSSKGTISVNAYRKAIEYQKENNQNYLDIAKAQAGYSGSHHSWNYYWDGFSKEQIADFSNQIGRNWNGSIWNLTPEEMKLLRGNVDMWTQIQSTGKGNYGGRLTERLDDYIDQAGKLEELTNQLYEGLTAISFDGVYDSFVDSLMNMKYSAKDAAEDISEYFMRAMLSNRIGELYADKLEEWWQDFGKAMEDGTLDEKEREELLNRYLGYIDEAAQLRDDIAAATGYTGDGGSTQSGKSGAFSQSITYDQGAKLEGLFTSGQMHWASIDDRMENVSDKMNTAENHLAKIEENTGNCVKELKEIKDEVKKQNRDGVKVK